MKKAISLLLCFMCLTALSAQRPMSLRDVEALFLERYGGLIAEQYAVNTADARIIQARIYPLPQASAEVNAINPEQPRFLDVGRGGQKALAVQQVILLGRKKQYEIEWAKSDAQLARLSYEQLLRDLRLSLRQAFYTVFFEQKKLKSLENQFFNIDSLVSAYAVQAQKNNVAVSDLVRLQALALTLKNNILDIQQHLEAAQEQLRILTAQSEDIVPQVPEARWTDLLQRHTWPRFEQALDTLWQRNPDYRLAAYAVDNKQIELKYQQSLAVPDLTVGLSYDQRGGAFRNQINLTAAMPLPLWHINKGQIQATEWQIKQQMALKDGQKQALEQSLRRAYNVWQQRHQAYLAMVQTPPAQMQQVYAGVLANFRKSNISLLAFTDFMESYSQHILQMNDMEKELWQAGEALFGLTAIDWLQ